MKSKSYLLLIPLTFILFSSSALAQRGVVPTTSRRPATAQVATRSAERSCEDRLNALKTRMTQLVRLADNQKSVFDSIADRVKTFYTDTVVPQGITVANYDALVADIDAKKAAVDTAISDAQAATDDFTCDEGSNARTAFSTFRTNMQAVKTALHQYRFSIRNLIVAVHTALPDETPTP